MPDLYHAKQSRFSNAKTLTSENRTRLALDAIAGKTPITELAEAAGTSRKFVHQLKRRGVNAVEKAFTSVEKQDEVLFYIPVTVGWLKSVVVFLMLVCHAPFRGIQEFLRVMCCHDISLGTIHNVAREMSSKAEELNSKEDLKNIKQGAHDEIFQAGAPVLVGVCVKSSYCYLLELVEHRDATTWGCALLDAQSRGLSPQCTVADFGLGLRAGQREVWGPLPCQGDVFHLQRELGQAVYFLEKQAYKAIVREGVFSRKPAKTRRNQLAEEESWFRMQAIRDMDAAIASADNLALLEKWVAELLQLSGPTTQERRDLLLWIAQEMKRLERAAPLRIGPARRLLEGHLDELLLFASTLDQRLHILASDLGINELALRDLFKALMMPDGNAKWSLMATLRAALRENFHLAEARVVELIRNAPARASSLVENINSRLRSYFFLRRQLGPGYLHLLRFFLNHHRFVRSDNPDRRGRSPAEVLAGRSLPLWLETLGLSTGRAA